MWKYTQGTCIYFSGNDEHQLFEFGLKDSINFSQTQEFINGKQTRKWSAGHFCMDGISGNEK